MMLLMRPAACVCMFLLLLFSAAVTGSLGDCLVTYITVAGRHAPSIKTQQFWYGSPDPLIGGKRPPTTCHPKGYNPIARGITGPATGTTGGWTGSSGTTFPVARIATLYPLAHEHVGVILERKHPVRLVGNQVAVGRWDHVHCGCDELGGAVADNLDRLPAAQAGG